MLTVYPPSDNTEAALTSAHAIWVDLLRPTDDERNAVESRYGVTLPTRDELSEVELSSRVSEENGVLFLNIPTISPMSGVEHRPSPVGFVLGKDFLVTIRYAELRSFDSVIRKFPTHTMRGTSVGVFSAIVDEMVDLSADLLEEVADGLEVISRGVFSKLGQQRDRLTSNEELRNLLTQVGHAGERLSRIRDSVLGLQRIVPYVASSEVNWIPHELRVHLETPRNDLASLNEYQTHLSDKVQFLLDAVLGFITIKQSDIFQVLTVISIVGIPPTLVASIYGMNFKNMPELSWTWGYQYGLVVILISAIVPILWFKWKKWI
jgi:magnesium transporter